MFIKKNHNIYKKNIGKSGVHRWVNKLNGKSYVISSINLSYELNLYYYLSLLRREVKGSIIIDHA
jgi:hypothetical protein